jgi:hyaluronan synthase
VTYASWKRVAVVALGILLAATFFAYRHWEQITTQGVSNVELIFSAAFVWLLFMTVLPYFHRDVKTTPAIDAFVKRALVHVSVPAHNEDPKMFLAMLDSLNAQTKKPNTVHVVENGDLESGYVPQLEEVIKDWTLKNNPSFDIRYDFNNEPSKREAQAIGWQLAHERTDVFATVDSDVILDKNAIETGVRPFYQSSIMSVGGILFGRNYKKNLLTRLIEIGFISSFLNGRASFSMSGGSVTVQSGGLAFYRAWVVHKYLDHYLNHLVYNRKMAYGDDAMMSRYALIEGKNLFQGGCVGYTLHPVNIKHLTKQRLRWWRSFFWGNEWFLRTFNPTRGAWWLVAWQMVNFAWYTVLIPYLLVFSPMMTGVFHVEFLLWTVIISMFSSARGLTVRRENQTRWDLMSTIALSPLVGPLNFYLGFVLQYAGLATCLKTGWGTRKKVEVVLAQ